MIDSKTRVIFSDGTKKEEYREIESFKVGMDTHLDIIEFIKRKNMVISWMYVSDIRNTIEIELVPQGYSKALKGGDVIG